MSHLDRLIVSVLNPKNSDINVNTLRSVCFHQGCPDNDFVSRSLAWKILLGYLPPNPSEHSAQLRHHREQYLSFLRDFIIDDTPSNAASSNGPSECDDHPLNTSSSSKWSDYFKQNILLQQINKDCTRLWPDINFFQQCTSDTLALHRRSDSTSMSEATVDLPPTRTSPASLEPNGAFVSDSGTNQKKVIESIPGSSTFSKPPTSSLLNEPLNDALTQTARDAVLSNSKHPLLTTSMSAPSTVPSRTESFSSNANDSFPTDSRADGIQRASSPAAEMRALLFQACKILRVRADPKRNELTVDPHISGSGAPAPLFDYQRSLYHDQLHQYYGSSRAVRKERSESGTLPIDGAQFNWEVVQRLLFIYARLHTGTAYVQGMNEIIGPVYYVFANGAQCDCSCNANECSCLLIGPEADAFFCFNLIMSELRDRFIKSLDNTASGIREQLDQHSKLLARLLPDCSIRLKELNILPEYYAFRWLTLLLSQEFKLPDLLRLWDALFSDTHRFNYLHYVCIAMIDFISDRIKKGEFTNIMHLLQNLSSECEQLDIGDLLVCATRYYPSPPPWPNSATRPVSHAPQQLQNSVQPTQVSSARSPTKKSHSFFRNPLKSKK